VTNDFALSGIERVIVVTGPNQGGKTTFARMFGQLHYLASLGLPVPGTEAVLLLPDRVFTHFERQEEVATLRGKLEEELVRVRAILDEATERSVVVMNESFSSTSLEDARRLGRRVIERFVAHGALCVYVTFVDELASLGAAVVSMVATVDPADPATRTFRVVRAPANGRAYAAAIARKYGLTPGRLYERVQR
jgi:DNA mismatch repair ATPase MutS